MFHKCYECDLISLIYKDDSKKTKGFFTDSVFCPYCGSNNVNPIPLWIIQQNVEYYLKKKEQGLEVPADYEFIGDIEYLVKILEIAEQVELLKKLGE